MEDWRPVPIPGFEYFYRVSTEGRIQRQKTGHIVKPWLHKSGYLFVSLNKPGEQLNRKLHTIVAKAFLVSDPYVRWESTLDGLTVNHINGLKTDNCVANLEIITRLSNIEHGWTLRPHREGMGCRGSSHSSARLTEEDIPVIRRLREEGLSTKVIAERYHMTSSNVVAIVTRRSWKHVP